VPCPHCAAFQVLQFPQLTWPKGKPELAVYVCHVCGCEIEHQHKRDMVHAGEWRPGPHPQFPDLPAPPPFAGHASFHLWAGYSFSPNATWGQLAGEFVAATHAGPEHLKTFVNTVLGEPWQERGDAPEWQRLYARRQSYAIGTCPREVLFLTAGVDVQKDRLVYEIVGWGREKRSWSIDASVLVGETSDTTERGPWLKLNALLNRQFPHEGGLDLSISLMAVDSGYNTQVVYGWARQHPMSQVIAVRGVPTAHVLIGVPSKVEVSFSGKRSKSGYKVWPIATNLAKSELYGWLALEAPTTESLAAGGTYPAGFCQFPEYGEAYFTQLTAEQLVSHRSQKGYLVFGWELIPGRENHHLDARIYARSAAAVAGLDRFREGDWAQLEQRLGLGTSAAAPVAGTTPSEPPPDRPEPPASPRRSSNWLGSRRGSWLKGHR
jgi:phage terminase large subunit GpA-like protein